MKIKTRFALLALGSAAFLSTAAQAATVNLFDHNVIATGTFKTGSHVDGSTVAGSLQVFNQPVFAMKSAGTTGKGLILAGGVTGNGLTLQSGQLVSKTALPTNGFSFNNNSGISPSIDAALGITPYADAVSAASAGYKSLSANSTASLVNGKTLTFTPGASVGSNLAVFTIPDSLFKTSNLEFNFNLGSAKGAVINITLASGSNGIVAPSQGNFLGASAALASKILWNFSDSNALNLSSGWYGTVLGPNLSVNMGSNAIDGGVYARNIDQNGEIHLASFTGGLPPGTPVGGSVPVVPLPSAVLAGPALFAFTALLRRLRRR